MEQLGQAFGFVHYEAVLPVAGPAFLECDGVRDRAQIFLDGQPVGVLERERHETALTFHVPRAGAVLTVLVENQGRVNYGEGIHDRKGLVGAVRLNGMELHRWRNRALPLDSLAGLTFAPPGGGRGPSSTAATTRSSCSNCTPRRTCARWTSGTLLTWAPSRPGQAVEFLTS